MTAHEHSPGIASHSRNSSPATVVHPPFHHCRSCWCWVCSMKLIPWAEQAEVAFVDTMEVPFCGVGSRLAWKNCGWVASRSQELK